MLPIHRTLSGATTKGQSGPYSNNNEEILWIPWASGMEAYDEIA